MTDYSRYVQRVAAGEAVSAVGRELAEEIAATGKTINWEGARVAANYLRGQAGAIDSLIDYLERIPAP